MKCLQQFLAHGKLPSSSGFGSLEGGIWEIRSVLTCSQSLARWAHLPFCGHFPEHQPSKEYMPFSHHDSSTVFHPVSANDPGQQEEYMVCMLHCVHHCAFIKHLLHTWHLGIYRNNQIYWYCPLRIHSREFLWVQPAMTHETAKVINC